MSAEAYTVSYDRTNYRAPIKNGLKKEEVLVRREETVRDNMLRYLGEYRIGVKFGEFFYRVETDPVTSEKYFASNEPGKISNVFRKAIAEREQLGLSVKREVAECLGFQKLEEKLLKTNEDMLFVWVSPPGSQKDGYGRYSFTFVGQAITDIKTGERKIRVVPYRNIANFQEHQKNLSRFTNKADSFKKDTDFLSNPIVFSPTDKAETPEDVIILLGEEEGFNIDWQKQLEKRVGFLIDGYVDLVKKGAPDEELIKARHAIENYTIAIKDELFAEEPNKALGKKDFHSVIDKFGKEAPPPIKGSCGPTLKNHHEENKPWVYHTGDCVVCHTQNTQIGPCSICKECEKKFDEK